ncbi:signal peptidase I [Haloimpatiens lingqiaonensis]|uniref:signal peptidase I n=1 Tax=Haloimpatiens lingqiaonensis TaxID=1380675 RepID=UPI0010FD0635|nr:signal peptidase I [Haloimpatiens lingqiaonensis]
MYFVKNFFKEWVVPVLAALILAFLINKFVFFFISVPTESMYPTIKPGDKIGVTKVYKKDKLKRGDIVVFYSKELKVMLIKRLIGVPGDKIDVAEDGAVYVNGEKKSETYVKNPGGKANMSFQVPKDKFLFMGDNRANSLDARYWNNKYIDKDDIKGKAHFVIFPFSRVGKLK